MVSSISRLLYVVTDVSQVALSLSNLCATAESVCVAKTRSRLLLCLVIIALFPSLSAAQADVQESTQGVNETAAVGKFLAGAMVGLAAHESGHLLFDGIFGADPGVKRVDFYGIPFFAITHRDVSRRKEFVISSAGFWVQHATSEWILTRRPRIRGEHAPFLKGVLAFNVGASTAYSIAAFAKIGPPERDTRGMAVGARLDEGWIGAIVLAPAVLDAWRYLNPDARWAVWVSRAVKVGGVLLVFR